MVHVVSIIYYWLTFFIGPQEEISEHRLVSCKLLLLEALDRPQEMITGSLTEQSISSCAGPKLHKKDEACGTRYCPRQEMWMSGGCAVMDARSGSIAIVQGCHKRMM